MLREFDFIHWIKSRQKQSKITSIGIGDDLADIHWPAKQLLLTGADQVLDTVHFDSTIHSPKDIGAKAMNRNLSDCAAMGCLPVAATVTFAIPRGMDNQFLKDIYRGIQAAGEKFDCQIVGGDTGSWDGKLAISVAIIGRCDGQPVQRNGARPGDRIYVTGPLGGSILGRHLKFKPRVELGTKLRLAGVTSMIDLSDGLSRDLGHLCKQSDVGALIAGNDIPIHRDAIKLSQQQEDDRSPLHHALHDGEDYELLYTVSSPKMPNGKRWPGKYIGDTMGCRDILLSLDGEISSLKPEGWEHTL